MRFRITIANEVFDENKPPVFDAECGLRAKTIHMDISKTEMDIPADWFSSGRNHRKVADALLKDEVSGRMTWYIEADSLSDLKELQERAGDDVVVECNFLHEAGPTITLVTLKNARAGSR